VCNTVPSENVKTLNCIYKSMNNVLVFTNMIQRYDFFKAINLPSDNTANLVKS